MRGLGLCLLLLVGGCATTKPATKAKAKPRAVKLEPGAAWWPAMGELGSEGASPLRPR